MFILFLLSHFLLASETDQFTARLYPLEDATKILNEQVNTRLKLAEQVLLKKATCEPDDLYNEVSWKVRRPIYGQIEGWMNSGETPIPFVRIPLEESIYQDISFYENWPVRIYKIGMGSTFKINQELIGSDKIGHFFDEGWSLFSILLKTGSVEKALDYSDLTEDGIFGRLFTGVMSNADKVANFNGMRFWSTLLGEGMPLKGKAYFKCVDGHFKLIRSFQFEDYIDAAWDESINCNQYRSLEFAELVHGRIAMLGMSCPVNTIPCDGLKEKYQEFSKRLLHPSCHL